MKIFLSDLWNDLREKRLWPVALVLALALVAVPVLLAKPAEEPPPSSATAVKVEAEDEDADAAELAQVKLGEESSNTGSTLGVFDPSNPFKPPKGAIEKEKADQGGGAGNGGTGSGSGGSGSGSGSETIDESSNTTDVVIDEGDGGGEDTGGGTKTTTTTYKYVVDLTFKANGRTRRIKGLEKLDVLPNQAMPLLIFMGVTPKGSDAVFLVDSTLQAAGEGRCKPSENNCAFAYVGAGSEYQFTNEEGDSYNVRIDEIRKVKVTPGRQDTTAAKGATANAAVGSTRRFVPPILADLVVVATNSIKDSNTRTDRR